MKKYFHGENKSGPYFEGWYFKCQAQDGRSLALIPAIHIREDGQRSSSIQVITEDGIATYRGTKIQNWSARGAALCQGRYRLEVQLLEQKAQSLRAPSEGDMNRTVHESLCAKVRYRFWRDRDLLFDHTDEHAGFEYAKS